MKAIIRSFYREPVVVLGTVGAVATAAAAQGYIPAGIAFVIVAGIVPLQRRFVRPAKV